MTLSWTRPSAGVDADIIYRYQVNGGAITDIPGSDATTTSYTWELLPGSHQIAIWALNVKANFGGSIFTRRVSVAGPSAPSDLRAEVGDDEVTLRWRRSPDGRIGGYQYQVDGGRWSSAQGVPGTGTEFRIAGLTNKQEYTFRLRARGDWYGLANSNYGYGPFAEVRATPNQLLPAPTGLAVKAGTQGATSFTVEWNAVTNAMGYVATATSSGSTTISGHGVGHGGGICEIESGHGVHGVGACDRQQPGLPCHGPGGNSDRINSAVGAESTSRSGVYDRRRRGEVELGSSNGQ